MTQHTPGPITFDGIGINIDGQRIATLRATQVPHNGGWRQLSPEEMNQIGTLIAAAPELLAALEKALTFTLSHRPKASQGHEDGCMKYTIGGRDMWGCDCTICAARAAIAKALGDVAGSPGETDRDKAVAESSEVP